MKRKHLTDPPLRVHKATGQAYVNLSGRRKYLGKAGGPDVELRYSRLLREWKQGGRQPIIAHGDLTIVELCARYWSHAKDYYAASPGELGHYKVVLRRLQDAYGDIDAHDFGPRAFRTVRDGMVASGWCRRHVNDQAKRLRRIFKWAVECELLEPPVLHGLQAVESLRRGRTKARESKPVQPVADAHIRAVKPHVSRQVWGLIQLQLATGARGGELCAMRVLDLHMSGRVWEYKPRSHKTERFGHERRIWIGPRGQDVLRPFLQNRRVDAHIFNPQEAEAERRADCATHRRANQPPTPRMTERRIGDCYTQASYRKAIERACRTAKIPTWTPHRLRHNAASMLRREFGIDVAACVLGHALGSTVTEIYAQPHVEAAIAAISKVG